MGELLGVTVEELVGILKKRGARLPFEIGAFVALEVCEQLVEGPAVAKASEVRIGSDGSITVYAPPNSATEEQAARSVVDVLAHLLVAAGQGVPPVLLDLVERGPADGRWELGRLRDELEASLVPLNRAAARRVLSRMLREGQREPSAASGASGGEGESDVDADLDALLGEVQSGGADPLDGPTEETELPEHGATEGFPSEEHTLPREPAPAADGGAGGARDAEPARPPSSRPPPAGPPSSRPPPAAEPSPRPQAEPAGPSSRPPTAAAAPAAGGGFVGRAPLDLERLEEQERASSGGGRKGLLWLLGFLALAVAAIGAIAVLRPDAIDRLMGRAAPEDAEAKQRAAERAAERERMLAEQRGKYGDLTISTAEGAQVLLFVGRGPAEAQDLPVGVAHEMVAIADGQEPTRAVVPKDAQWEQGEQGPRYELAMQTGDEAMPFDELELGDTKLPQDVGSPGGELGTVRVITNPPGAKVYLLIGFGPTVRVRDVSTQQAQELLVYLEGHPPEKLVVGPSDWQKGPEGPHATIEAPFEGGGS